MRKFLLVPLIYVLGLASDAGAVPLLCVAQTADGKLEGAIQTRADACASGEIEIGRVIDGDAGLVEFSGEEVLLPEGSYDPSALPPAGGGNG